MIVALFFQHPIGRGMMIQILAITRLELILHCRHPDILDQLTGDPEQDEPFWQNLEENEPTDFTLTATTITTITTTIPAVINDKIIGRYLPCIESKEILTPTANLSFPDIKRR